MTQPIAYHKWLKMQTIDRASLAWLILEQTMDRNMMAFELLEQTGDKNYTYDTMLKAADIILNEE